MTDIKTELATYGIDYDEAMERMGGSADFYEKLAMKYLNDTHYVDLVAAMEAKDFSEAYEAAHALKGVSGNLSMTDLFKASAAVSDALYQGEYQAAETLMPQVTAAHEKVVEGLEKWQNGEL